MARRTRRSFPEEFKAEAVRLAHGSPNLAAVARNLDIDVSTLHAWVRRAAEPQTDSDSLSISERQELLSLRRENTVLKMEREILKNPRPSSPRKADEVFIHRRGEGPLSGHRALPRAQSPAQRLLRLAPAPAFSSSSAR